MVPLSAPAVPSPGKHEGWEGSAKKSRLNFGEGDRGACAGGCSHPGGNGHVCRDSSRERCPSNPDLICFILRTINPSSLPVVPYHGAKARTEPLKLTITQSECLFGVIQAWGKVREGEEEGSCFFSTRYRQPRSAKVVLKQDECLNNRWQTALPGDGMGEPWPPLATELWPSGWDASVSPQPMGSPVQEGVVLYWWEGKVPTSFPLAFCHRAALGRNLAFPDVFSFHPQRISSHVVSPPGWLLIPLPNPISHEEGARVESIHIQTFPLAVERHHPSSTLKLHIPEAEGSPVPNLPQTSCYPII